MLLLTQLDGFDIEKAEEICNDFSVKFSEWLAENHYRLYNVKDESRQWINMSDEIDFNFETTTELQKYFKNNIYGK